MKNKNTLGIIKRIPQSKRQRDVFKTNFNIAEIGQFGMEWISAPSVLSRTIPLFVVGIVALLILSAITPTIRIAAFITIVIILAMGIYIVIWHPEKALIVDTRKAPYTEKNKQPIEEAEISYQPKGDISSAKNT